MERFGGGFKQGFGWLGFADKGGAVPPKERFKLSLSKVPLPLQTEKIQQNQEAKPKGNFLTLSGAGLAKNKQSLTRQKSSSFAASSFMRQPAKDGKTPGFSFMKFQPESGGLEKSTCSTLPNATQLASADTNPLRGKFGVSAGTEIKNTSTAAKNDKRFVLKSQERGSLPFAAQYNTDPLNFKKRKATQDKKNVFPSKSGRGNPSLTLQNPVCNKEKDTVNMAGASAKMTEATSFAFRQRANDGASLKKRSLLVTSTVAIPALKRSKTPTDMLPTMDAGCAYGAIKHTVNGMVKANYNSVDDACGNNVDSSPSEPLAPPLLESTQTPSHTVADAGLNVDLGTGPSNCQEEYGADKGLAMNLLCTIDDEKDDEFLNRAAAIQELTDRMGLEQKLLRNRLLDAHADVSESLLDSLTDLMLEVGGVGINKLNFDVHVDVDLDDVFHGIQVFQ